MEKQLEDVEQRLGRRERELSAIIEDVKTSAKMERSRLESIHTQVSYSFLLELQS